MFCGARRLLVWGVSLFLCACAAASCDDAHRAPTSPEARVVRALSISGFPDDFSVGHVVQLRANASYSTGDREDVTGAARWSSRTLACAVTTAGVVTGLEVGDCSVEAAYGGATTSATVSTKPSKVYTISGVVREKWGFREPPLPGATVTLVSGTSAGRTVTTDGAGRYVLPAVPVGPVSARAEAAGYEPSTADLSPERATTDFFLVPPVDTITWSVTTTDVTIYSGSARSPFQMGHRGPVTMTLFSTQYECGTYELIGANIKSLDSNAIVLSGYPCPPGVASTVEKMLDPGRYELTIWWVTPGTVGTIRRVDVKYPR